MSTRCATRPLICVLFAALAGCGGSVPTPYDGGTIFGEPVLVEFEIVDCDTIRCGDNQENGPPILASGEQGAWKRCEYRCGIYQGRWQHVKIQFNWTLPEQCYTSVDVEAAPCWGGNN